MYRLFDIVLPSGKLGPCTSSLEHARREIGWLRSEHPSGQFSVREVARERRRGVKWCGAKNEEFRRRYTALTPIRELEDHFDCAFTMVHKKARQFGFGHRIDDPRTFERHNGRWTEREHRLVNLMYDEGIGVTDIPGHHPRTQKAVTAALRVTARTYSTRSKFGRFIVAEGARGRRKKTIHRVLEQTSESSFHSDEGDEEDLRS